MRQKIVLIVVMCVSLFFPIMANDLNIESISLTSGITFDKTDKWRYSPYKALDGNDKTSFAIPKEKLDYPGKMFRVFFSDELIIDEIHIQSGYFDQDYFKKNYRIKKLTLLFNESHQTKETSETKESFILKDEIDKQVIKLSKPIKCDEIWFLAEELYPSQKYDDICITELSFYRNGNLYKNNIRPNKSFRTFSYDNNRNLVSCSLKGDHIDYEIRYSTNNDGIIIGESYNYELEKRIVIDKIYPVKDKCQKKILNNIETEDYYDSNGQIIKTIVINNGNVYETKYYYKNGKLCGNEYGEYIYCDNVLLGFLSYDYYISNYEIPGSELFNTYNMEYDLKGSIVKKTFYWFYGFSAAH